MKVKMEIVCFSETSVHTYQTARYHNPEDYNRQAYVFA
jgi:hypothetical protein